LDLFQSNYLSISQNDAPAIDFPHKIAFQSNTGIPSGFDLNNNGHAVTTIGASGYGDDAFGFGAFPGQHAFALLSKFPILENQIRTFQQFKWKDMPDNLMSSQLSTYYSPEEQNILRLSSKNHAD